MSKLKMVIDMFEALQRMSKEHLEVFEGLYNETRNKSDLMEREYWRGRSSAWESALDLMKYYLGGAEDESKV